MEGYWTTSIALALLVRGDLSGRRPDSQPIEAVEGIVTRVAWPCDDPHLVLVTTDGESVRLALDPTWTRVWHRHAELAWDAVRPGQRAVAYYRREPGRGLARDIEVLDESDRPPAPGETAWEERLEASDRWARLTAAAVFAAG